MFRGFYAGTSAMLVQEKMLDVAANNLANVDTAGFRGRIAVNKAFPELLMEKVDGSPGEVYPPKPELWKRRELIGDMAFANVLSETALDLRGGSLRHTGNPLDVANRRRGVFCGGGWSRKCLLHSFRALSPERGGAAGNPRGHGGARPGGSRGARGGIPDRH